MLGLLGWHPHPINERDAAKVPVAAASGATR
jgi:hypothetical protein